MFQINKTVKALLFLALAYLIGTIVSYSTFLQIPVFSDSPLMWQSIVEQSLLWILPVVVLYMTYFVINARKLEKVLIDEKKLVLPAFLLVLVTGIGIGVHAVAQIVEDALINSQGTSLFQFVYFIDETLGHALLLPANFVGIIFSIIEMNRKGSVLNKIDKVLIYLLAIVNGLIWGFLSIEGGSLHLLVIVISILSLVFLNKHIKKHRLDISKFVYTKYFFIASYTMIIFVLIYMILFGVFVQPSDLGFKLFSL